MDITGSGKDPRRLTGRSGAGRWAAQLSAEALGLRRRRVRRETGNCSKLNEDGFQQRESAFGIGCLKDGKLVSWTEQFDGCSRNLPRLQPMPMEDIDQAIFQWPAKSILRIDDRP